MYLMYLLTYVFAASLLMETQLWHVRKGKQVLALLDYCGACCTSA